MPLYQNAIAMMRANLEALARGERPPRIEIGELTSKQLQALNDHRLTANPAFKPMIGTVVFIGRHVHLRRIQDDGYTIDDVLDRLNLQWLQRPCLTAAHQCSGSKAQSIVLTVMATPKLETPSCWNARRIDLTRNSFR